MRSTACVLAALCLMAAPVAAQTASDHVQMGKGVEDLDPRTGLMHYREALALDSVDYEALWRASDALVDIGKQIPDTAKSPARDSMYAEAEVLARRAVAADSMGADGHFALAQAIGRASLTKSKKERVKRAKEIRDEALRAIALDPEHDGAYHVLGRWNAEIMRLSGLTRFFAKTFLGGAVFNEASWDNAQKFMEKAVAINPSYVYHHLDLAEILIDREEWPEARTQLELVESLPATDAMDPTYKAEGTALLAKIADKK
ncbi:MAG: tetratricopeptide repeat protein [Gemmatimonadales bacterium]